VVVQCKTTAVVLILSHNCIQGNSTFGVLTWAPAKINYNLIRYNWGVGGVCSIPSTYTFGLTPTIANNIICSNTGSGGGVQATGLHMIWSNMIYGNTGGPGVYCLNGTAGSPAVVNNTIAFNTGVHGGISIGAGAAVTIRNNIIYMNSEGITRFGSALVPTLNNNDVYANSGHDYMGVDRGSGDFSADPCFVNESSGDYHLQYVSPCRDVGYDVGAGPNGVDIDGDTRIMPSGGTVDIGADEFRQYLWKPIPVYTSCPLVADLVPGGNLDLAIVSKETPSGAPGRIYVWDSDGKEETGPWSDPDFNTYFDRYGYNTLSAADIDCSGGTLEMTAPGSWVGRPLMYAFGYDATTRRFLPLAGWPQASDLYFNTCSAALGDSNLDGTIKVAAADESCFVYDWNAAGQLLWRQVTGSPGVNIFNSSVALGQINTPSEPNRPPEAVVGAETTPGLWGYEGDEWHDYVWNDPPYHYTDRWDIPYEIGWIQSSPAIGRIDNDDISDIAVGDEYGNLWVWLSTDSAWHAYPTGGYWYRVESSPAVVDIDGEHTVVFGCDNGRVYMVRWNPITSTLDDVAGWAGGIQLSETYPIKASVVIGDVVNAGDNQPQIVAACSDGNVYALWKDGTAHPGAGGNPVADEWTCVEDSYGFLYSTPTICSLNGTTVSLIVGSSEGLYKIDLYTVPAGTFVPGSARWPWPTFHHDAARTGCSVAPSTTMVSSSIIGRVKDSYSGQWIEGAQVLVQYWNGSTWVTETRVNGRPETRAYPLYTVGDGTPNNEINEGYFVINQLMPPVPPDPGYVYQLVINKAGYKQKTVIVNGGPPYTPLALGRTDVGDIQLTPQ
jgi:hypothetical protein